MNITFTFVFDNFIDSIYLRAIHGVIFCFSELITFVCYSGFLYYEFFGGDPMKRSLKNKLLSQSALIILVSHFTNSPGYSWRIVIGPLNKKVAMFVMFSRQFCGVYVILCFAEIVLYKVSMVFGFRHFNSIDEQFMFVSIIIFNTFFSIGTAFSRWMLGSFENNDYEILTGFFSKDPFHREGLYFLRFLNIWGLTLITWMHTVFSGVA